MMARVDGAAALGLLRAVDTEGWEQPENFDQHALSRRTARLVESANRSFRCECILDGDVQDASLFATVTVPGERTVTGDDIRIYISNHWPLATVAITNAGVWDQQELELLLAAVDERRIDVALDVGGFTAVPEHTLWADYDGVLSSQADAPRDWWGRYFDHM